MAKDSLICVFKGMPFEAEIVKSRLQDSGIPAMIQDNSLGAVFSSFTYTAGDVSVMVNPSDESIARALLADDLQNAQISGGNARISGAGMRSFTNVLDLGDLKSALDEALEIKRDRFKYVELGRNKTLLMVFFNSSLRTRLSTQKAAMNLGMNVIVLDVNQGAWKLETERGVIMDGDKSEHLLEAIPVMGCYCDVIGVRSFARFESREDDYSEKILNQFIRYSGRPVFSMEAATGHPLQSFADWITIEEYKTKKRPKVVMSWAPHPKSLPQAVPNSFAQWMVAAGYDLVITHPEGYELDPKFTEGATLEYDQMKAFENADFVYAKNWSAASPEHYGQILSMDRSWTVGERQMAVTDNAYFMHCLPVRRNMIVTDDVIEGPRSLVIPEAANREISATVVLKRILEGL